MDIELKKVFQQTTARPDAGLAVSVWSAICREENSLAKKKIFAYLTIGLASLIILIPVISSLTRSFAQSGFSQYFSLVFSDGSIFSSYWKEFLLTLVDSLPIFGLASCTLLVFIFVSSTVKAGREVKHLLVLH